METLQKSEVSVDAQGHPMVTIPFEEFWDFTEFISYHRLETHCELVGENFVMVFLRADVLTVQTLLHDWDGRHAAGPFYSK